MDPQATLDLAADHARNGDLTDALASLGAYREWRERGGVEPEGGDARAQAIRNDVHGMIAARDVGTEAHGGPTPRVKLVETDPTSAGEPTIVEALGGRLLIVKGFGGMNSLDGGAYRWRHGVACRLLPGDTLASLRETDWNNHTSLMDAVTNGYDEARPALTLPGYKLVAIAAAAFRHD